MVNDERTVWIYHIHNDDDANSERELDSAEEELDPSEYLLRVSMRVVILL